MLSTVAELPESQRPRQKNGALVPTIHYTSSYLGMIQIFGLNSDPQNHWVIVLGKKQLSSSIWGLSMHTPHREQQWKR